MKTKKEIHHQLLSYEKSYADTKDFETFNMNIYHILEEIENITPVTPYYSSYLFQTKLDYENMDRNSASKLVQSLKTFLERLE